MPACPLCEFESDIVLTREVPVQQNRIHRSRESSASAPVALLELASCPSCGFAWNSAFDPMKMTYDEQYNNDVPSQVMRDHLARTRDHILKNYRIAPRQVIDIGCGNGELLHLLHESAPGLQLLGIDPSYRGPEDLGKLQFRKAYFRQEHITRPVALVICRHTLEHIPDPVSFLKLVHDAAPVAPIYVEVPDLAWTLENGAFFDFCYEHVNYFAAQSLAMALEIAGYPRPSIRSTYGGQYLVAETGPSRDLPGRLALYARNEADHFSELRYLLEEKKKQGKGIAVWGCTTKGVLFSRIVDPDGDLIDHYVDANPGRQGAYLPVTARQIESPAVLAPGPVLVVVMNPIYQKEIANQCRDLGVEAELVPMGA